MAIFFSLKISHVLTNFAISSRCIAKSGKMIDTPVGQLIVAACVIHNILALIILTVLKVLVKDNPPIYQYFIPLISSISFLIVLGGLAITWMLCFIKLNILRQCKDSYCNLAMFTVMTLILLAYLLLMNYTQASYLTGAFLCGCIFSQIENAPTLSWKQCTIS